MKKMLFIVAVMVMAVMFSGISYAQVKRPHNFWGNITQNGTALVGATVKVVLGTNTTDAVIDDNNVPSTNVTSATSIANGYYDINVQLTGTSGAVEGAVVHIFVNGVESTQTAAGTTLIVEGASTELNLSAGSVVTTTTTTTTTLLPTTTTTTVAPTTTTVAPTTTTTTVAPTTTTTTTTGDTTTTTTVAGCSVAGDVNNDGKKDIYDALAIAEYDVGKLETLACPGNADADGDNKVTIYDALKIAETIVGRSI